MGGPTSGCGGLRAAGQWGGLALVCLLLSGCGKELFAGEPTRSQYDRYDRMQTQYAEPYVYDPFGARRPNLRARLLPRD